jgi:hypothetical protein
VRQGVVLLVAAVLATACGGPSHRADSAPAVDQLASMLADESAVNAIMGTTTMRAYYRYRTLPGWPEGEVYSRPDCLVVTANAMEPEYAGSRYGEMRGTRLLDSDPAVQTSIDEAVVAFESPAAAQSFVAATVRAWKPCANTLLTITAKDKPTHHWNLGSARVVDGVDVVDADHADTTRGWRGSRALRASKSVVIDVRVTGFGITDQAIRLVNAIAGRDRL